MPTADFAIVLPMHIYDFDPQGSLSAVQKQDMYAFAARTFRDLYPEAHLIITGHGLAPCSGITSAANDVIWDEGPQNMRSVGTFIGNPAQYKNVGPAIKLARDKGIKTCLKARGDVVIYAADYIHDLVHSQADKLHLTQQTSFIHPMLGDCVMLGSTEVLAAIWDETRGVSFEDDGLINTGLAFLDHFHRPMAEWNALLFDICAFHDVPDLQYVDLRWNWVAHQETLMKKTEFSRFYWGKTPGWIEYEEDKIVHFDRPIFYTSALFSDKLVREIVQQAPISLTDKPLSLYQQQIATAICKLGNLR